MRDINKTGAGREQGQTGTYRDFHGHKVKMEAIFSRAIDAICC
jgi:hypothetical protein